MRWLTLFILALLLSSCSRAYYRESADKDSYAAILERPADPRWNVPDINIQPPPASRLYNPYDPDRPPMPPDDPTADTYMHEAYGMHGWKHWWDNGTVDSVELTDWYSQLPLVDGKLKLDPDRIMQQAQLQGREYRTQLENLYLTSLNLTLNRFEFATQWFATNATNFEHFGSGGTPTETNTLSTNSNIGFHQSFAAGGQLLVNFANSFVWEYAGRTNSASSTISMNFIQPLLRDFGREVRLEALTQGERSLLYQLRIFARFRKQLYVDLAVNQYLALLQQQQLIRNQETNVIRQEQNYANQQAQRLAGKITSVQEDQAYTSLLEARAAIIQARTILENSLDSYKLRLGLPPTVQVAMDDQPLLAFLFSDPKLDQLQIDIDQQQRDFRMEYEKLTTDRIQKWLPKLTDYHQQAQGFLRQILAEADRWSKQPLPVGTEVTEQTRLKQFREGLLLQLNQVKNELTAYPKTLESYRDLMDKMNINDRKRQFELRLRELELSVGQLFVIQNQVRVYSLNLPRVSMTEQEALRLAIENRLDLMNARAQVVDTWRQVAIQANQLGAVLNLVTGMDIGTDPSHSRPFNFSAIASSYRVGVQFEGPLNREIARNNYRQSLIQYDRARRDYMAVQDQVMLELRQVLRQLDTDRQNFEITRRAFIAATRQVESVPLQLSLNRPINPLEQLNALSQLLNAKNQLISNWFSYERGRVQLLLSTEQLQLDSDGMYRDGQQLSPGSEKLSAPAPVQQRAGDTPRPAELFPARVVFDK